MAFMERLMPRVGDVIRDRYELLDVLGEGGFGIVFRARQRGLDNDVALKVLLPHLLAHDALVQRFEREVTVVKSLKHPNTIRVLDVGQTDNEVPFYVMEFVSGRTLESVLNEGAISPDRTRRIAVQLLKSLAEAHERGVVHRDLKPGNIMLCEVFGESDYVKVLDFGIAKAIEDDKAGGLVTQTGAILGTPTYLSPEQARGEKNLDPRSDIYAVGLILAECIVGEPVVSGNSTYEVVAAHAQPGPLAFAPGLRSSPFYEVVARATHKNRDLRYQTASDMVDAILALEGLAYDPLFEVITTGSQPRRTPPRSRDSRAPATPEFAETAMGMAEPRRPRALIWLFAAAVVGVAIALALSVGQGTETSSTELAPPTPRVGPEHTPLSPEPGEAAGSNGELGTSRELAVVPTPPEPVALTPEQLDEAVRQATRGLLASLPPTRTVRLDGTEGARVLLGERELGRLPFTLDLPRLTGSVELRFERRGFESRTLPVSLADDALRIDLERRRETPPNESGEGPGPTTTPNSLPFGEAPIYD